MKYKVGDRVKVRQDLEYGKTYASNDAVITSFMEGMDVDSIEIEDVIDGFYRTHLSNGKDYAYTDEMLDGLVKEPEGEPKKPTDAELIQAAELLRANCLSRDMQYCDEKCVFRDEANYCILSDAVLPQDWHWRIPHRKTRKEVLLEKFPNAEIGRASCRERV